MKIFPILFVFLSLFSFSYGIDGVHLYDVYAYRDLNHKIIVKGVIWDEVIALEAQHRRDFIVPITVSLNREPFFLFKDKFHKNPNYKKCFINGKAGANITLKRMFTVLNELVCVNESGVPTLRKRVKGYLLDKETNLGISGKVHKIELIKGKKIPVIRVKANKKVIAVFQLR